MAFPGDTSLPDGARPPASKTGVVLGAGVTESLKRSIGTRTMIRSSDKIQTAAVRQDANATREAAVVKQLHDAGIVNVPAGGAEGPSAAAHDRCVCVLGKSEAVLGAFDDATRAALMAACMQEEAKVFAELAKAGVSVDGCRAWYMRRTTWLIGGVAGAGLLLFKFLRR